MTEPVPAPSPRPPTLRQQRNPLLPPAHQPLIHAVSPHEDADTQQSFKALLVRLRWRSVHVRCHRTLITDGDGRGVTAPVTLTVTLPLGRMTARQPGVGTTTPITLCHVSSDTEHGPIARHAFQRAGLPGPAIALILAHPNPGARFHFAMSARAEAAQRARLVDDPSPKVRAALAYGRGSPGVAQLAVRTWVHVGPGSSWARDLCHRRRPVSSPPVGGGFRPW